MAAATVPFTVYLARISAGNEEDLKSVVSKGSGVPGPRGVPKYAYYRSKFLSRHAPPELLVECLYCSSQASVLVRWVAEALSSRSSVSSCGVAAIVVVEPATSRTYSNSCPELSAVLRSESLSCAAGAIDDGGINLIGWRFSSRPSRTRVTDDTTDASMILGTPSTKKNGRVNPASGSCEAQPSTDT